MKPKKKMRLLSLLLCFMLLVGLMPTTAFAWTAPTLTGAKAEWNVQLSDDGWLTWNDMGSTTYDIEVDKTEMGSTVTKIYGVNTNSYNLLNRFRELKIENGTYYFTIKANDTDTTSGTIRFSYVSPEPKMSAPQNLRWDGTTAKWDGVAGAAEYTVTLMHSGGSVQLVKTTTETQYDWSTNVYNDGFWFEVIATADGYRDSNAAEGPKYGNYSWTAPTLTGGNAAWNVTLSNDGVLRWNDMGGTSYDIEVDKTEMGGTVTKIYGVNSNSYNLIDRLKVLKIENGIYYFTIKANGPGTNSGTIRFNYVSPEPKLPAPQNLYWDGTVAKWDSAAGATGYEVKLYSDSGSLQLSKTTSDTQYDWSTNVYNDGFWFEVVATADGYRDSDAAEGPAKKDLFTPINAISLQGLSVPVVGEHIASVHGSNLTEALAHSYKYEVIDNQYSDWKDEEGRWILYGQQRFEAGRTYSISFNIKPKDGYAFTSTDIPVELSNLYPYQYTGNITLNKESKIATVTFTFELGGERTYEDISEFRFYDVREPEDGHQVASQGVWAYNNSEMTDRYWTDSNGTRLENGTRFEGGNSYSYNYVFTAFDGYKFADSVSIRNDANIVDWQYSFNGDNTKIYITIPYYVKGSAIVSSITVNGMFIPVQGSTTGAFDAEAYMSAPDNANYEVANQLNDWFEADAEYVIDSELKVAETGFIAGKQYKMFLLIYADEDYKFASPENVSFTLSGIPENIYSYTCRQAGPEDIIEVAITFTAQFPPGSGTINNPVVVTSYDELKYALEDPDIQGIVVNSFENDPYQTFYTLEKGKDFKAGNLAITVPSGSTKYLTINADINIRVPYVDYLLYSFIGNYGDLTIGGTGSLNVSMNARGYPSAILYNSGNLEIGGNVTFDPTNKSFDSVHGYSVINNQGKTVINSGTFIGYDASAVMYLNGSMDIYGGTFMVENGDEDAFGLNTDSHLTIEDHDVNLYGGTFEGIRADQSTGEGIVKLPDLLAYGAYYRYTSDGARFDPYGKKDTHETLTVIMREIVNEVALTITAPKENETPSYAVGSASEFYGAAREYGVAQSEFVRWYESANGADGWTEMETTDKFQSGYYYKVHIDVMTLEDAWFDIYDNGVSFQPNVTATVNGYYGTVRKVEMNDPSKYMNVEYHFGQVNDSVIENIIITDVVTPVAGEYPSYNCNLQGSGYHLATYKDKNYDAYWAGEEWPMIKNGIGWWDVTNGDWHYGNKPFVFGHEYQIRVYVQTDDGYEFYTTGKYYETAGTAKVNGNAANMEMESMANREQEVRYTFTCQQATVSEVVVYGIDVPVAGNAPDYTALVGNANLYNFAPYGFESAGFWWYDSEDAPLTDEDTFVAGETYKLEIKLTPAMIGQAVVSRFQTPVTAVLNGKAVDSSDVMANSTTVYIYRTYTCEGTAGVSVLGQVTSFNDASGDVTLQLIPQGLAEPAYETIAKGNTVSYSFNNVAAGTYTLKVSKENHVTREYEVTVDGNDVVQDVKIHLVGDITGDGQINIMDVNRANLHFKKKITLTGYEFDCANVTGDAQVNIMDVNRMNLHFKGKSKLW